jgi:hypothetical protein
MEYYSLFSFDFVTSLNLEGEPFPNSRYPLKLFEYNESKLKGFEFQFHVFFVFILYESCVEFEAIIMECEFIHENS